MTMASYPFSLLPLGDSAVIANFTDAIDLSANQTIHHNVRILNGNRLSGIRDLIPTYGALTIVYDPLQLTYAHIEDWLLRYCDTDGTEQTQPSNVIEIPVVYGGEYGPDLASVAEHNHLTEAEVIRIHSSGSYPVYMMGFTPGFPYLGGLDPAIATPRLTVPRTTIRAGSVGIANTQTGIYSVASPGGWRLIGWTPKQLFDVSKPQPCLISPGDTIRFKPVSIEEANRVTASH